MSVAPKSVSEVLRLISDVLDAEPQLTTVSVTGEVSNLRSPRSGHNYFSLRDREAALNCVLFRYRRGARFLEDGAQVISHGRVGVYQSRGDLQLVVDSVEPVGYGNLQAAFQELKRKLASEGLFDQSRKRPLPKFPECIAVITSPQGAVLQDITKVLARRYPMLKLVVIPAAVQGAQAASEIVEAFANLDALSRATRVDAAILARGGGALEDLIAFNDESVARTIFACRTPVISGVGHETDHTIADMVADIRAPTPSAAAEISSPDMRDLTKSVALASERIRQNVLKQISDAQERFEMARDRMDAVRPDMYQRREETRSLVRRMGIGLSSRTSNARHNFELARAQLDNVAPDGARMRLMMQNLADRMMHGIDVRITAASGLSRESIDRLMRAAPDVGQKRADIESLRCQMQDSTARYIKSRSDSVRALESELNALGPINVLNRGFAIARIKDGDTVIRAESVASGDYMELTFMDGTVDAEALSVTVLQESENQP